MCGRPSAGNGAIMRIAPIILPYLKNPSKELWADTILAAIITHNDPASTGSCLALMNILWEILRVHNHIPGDDWFIKEFCRVLKHFEWDTWYPQRSEPFNYCGSLYTYVEEHTFDVPLRKMKSGAYMLETMPAIMYILTKWWKDPERAILEAVNSTKDNDTIASIVATVMGAMYGKDAFSKLWIRNLSGKLTDNGEPGRVFDLIEQARIMWWD
jgi:ADP-ribosylglycohydrolase